MEIIDLTHRLEAGMPFWPTHAKYERIPVETLQVALVEHARVCVDEHTGTHVDAPSHFINGAPSVDQVPLTRFAGCGRAIDARCVGPNGVVDADFLVQWEEQNGRLDAGDVVLFFFGWSLKWNQDQSGPSFNEDWPGVNESACSRLIEREVAAVGTDALSIDPANTTTFEGHRTLLHGTIPIFENVDNLDRVLGQPFTFMGWPLHIVGGSGSPVRAVAMVEDTARK